MISEFQVGMRYKGWSSAARYGSKAHDIVVVEIAPDRTYLMAYDPDDPELKAEKYKIKKSDYNEKVVTHPSAYTYFAWRGDKAVGKVDISKVNYVSGQKTRRKAGADKARKTRSDKAILTAIGKSLTVEKFYDIYAKLMARQYSHWYNCGDPKFEKFYENYSNPQYWLDFYHEHDGEFYVGNPEKFYFDEKERYVKEFANDDYMFIAEAYMYYKPEEMKNYGGRSGGSARLIFLVDKCYLETPFGGIQLLKGDEFLKYFGDIAV